MSGHGRNKLVVVHLGANDEGKVYSEVLKNLWRILGKSLKGNVFWNSPKIRKRYRNYEQSNRRQPMAGRMVYGGRFYIEEAV